MPRLQNWRHDINEPSQIYQATNRRTRETAIETETPAQHRYLSIVQDITKSTATNGEIQHKDRHRGTGFGRKEEEEKFAWCTGI